MKQEKKGEVKIDAYQVVTDRIIEKLEQGVVPWRMPWLRMQERPQSLFTFKPYRGINSLITQMAGFSSPYFLTYRQALEIGGQVKRGEHGIPIVYWGRIEKENDGMNESEEKKSSFFARYYTVFNILQVEGLPEKFYKTATLKQNDFSPIEAAEKILQKSRCKPNIQHQTQRAYYQKDLDFINLPKADSFTSSEEYYSTLFHELTHSTGHESRLNRKTLFEVNAFGDHSYSKEELVAELGSAFLCHESGITAKVIDNQASYISGWLEKLKGDKRLIVQAASHAQKAVDYLLNLS